MTGDAALRRVREGPVKATRAVWPARYRFDTVTFVRTACSAPSEVETKGPWACIDAGDVRCLRIEGHEEDSLREEQMRRPNSTQTCWVLSRLSAS